MRRERSLLQDMLESCEEIEQFIKGLSQEQFAQSSLVRSAVVQKLMVIGEAAARLPRPFRQRHTVVEWRDIIGFRNILVHAYFQVDWSIVWVAATAETPILREQIATIIATEFPES